MRICLACNASQNHDSHFCMYCGAALIDAADRSSASAGSAAAAPYFASLGTVQHRILIGTGLVLLGFFLPCVAVRSFFFGGEFNCWDIIRLGGNQTLFLIVVPIGAIYGGVNAFQSRPANFQTQFWCFLSCAVPVAIGILVLASQINIFQVLAIGFYLYMAGMFVWGSGITTLKRAASHHPAIAAMRGEASEMSHGETIQMSFIRGELRAITGADVGMTFPVAKSVTLIGREGGRRNDIVLHDHSCSRGQGRIIIDSRNKTFQFLNEGRTNATKINGQEVDSAFLQSEDELEFGVVKLRFRIVE